MRKRISELTGRLGDSLEIPRDLSCGEAVLTLTGSRELFIENYSSIRRYQETCILVLSRQSRIQIEGARLKIDYYTELEMKITGDIRRIVFL